MLQKFLHQQEISIDIFTEDADDDTGMLFIQIDGKCKPFDAIGHHPF